MTARLFYSIVTFFFLPLWKPSLVSTISLNLRFSSPSKHLHTVMNLKNSKRTMRNGFMCPSEASTAVWSAVVPRKRHERSVSLDDTRLINCSNYSRLVHSATATFNSAHNSLSSANIQQRSQNQENGSTQLHKTPTDHVFQVTHTLLLHTMFMSLYKSCYILNVHFILFILTEPCFVLPYALPVMFLSCKWWVPLDQTWKKLLCNCCEKN